MCINIETKCQSGLVWSLTIFIVFLANHSTFTTHIICPHIDFGCEFMFVHACVCACVSAWGVCSLIEFFSHRSVWQVALPASSVCSEQVLSWVRSCHIRLHNGPISESHILYTKLPSTFIQKRNTFQFRRFEFSVRTPSHSSKARTHSQLYAKII